MTSVRFYRAADGGLSGFAVVGHAGAGSAGQDIVCAGVSALALTAVNALETVAGVSVAPEMSEGFLSVRLPRGLDGDRLHDARVILQTVRQGMTDIAAQYPRHVRIRPI